MSVSYSQDGKNILALRRRQSPILYRTDNEKVQCEFLHPNYYNSCTMKSCSFAGQNDEYVTSGSDDFNLYFWKIPENESGNFFHGHLIRMPISLLMQIIFYSE